MVTATVRASSGYSRAHQHVSPPTHARRRTTAPRSGDRVLRGLRGRRGPVHWCAHPNHRTTLTRIHWHDDVRHTRIAQPLHLGGRAHGREPRARTRRRRQLHRSVLHIHDVVHVRRGARHRHLAAETRAVPKGGGGAKGTARQLPHHGQAEPRAQHVHQRREPHRRRAASHVCARYHLRNTSEQLRRRQRGRADRRHDQPEGPVQHKVSNRTRRSLSVLRSDARAASKQVRRWSTTRRRRRPQQRQACIGEEHFCKKRICLLDNRSVGRRPYADGSVLRSCGVAQAVWRESNDVNGSVVSSVALELHRLGS
mmetsp:Transcript_2767/g.7572  ORF Transcript_2767/g.7572 Transcript_2767/m.7572 type:complete len:311 (+) Transcript_2767:165-1097(+)